LNFITQLQYLHEQNEHLSNTVASLRREHRALQQEIQLKEDIYLTQITKLRSLSVARRPSQPELESPASPVELAQGGEVKPATEGAPTAQVVSGLLFAMRAGEEMELKAGLPMPLIERLLTTPSVGTYLPCLWL
jgi:hypothetical protein